MKIARVQIENFRHLGGRGGPFTLDFTDTLGRVRDFTLLVGPNASGKTTILDAIAAALGPGLRLPTLRTGFQLSPRTVVHRGALQAKVTCWLRFSPEEITATQNLFRLAQDDRKIPDVQDVQVTWVYPDRRSPSALLYPGSIRLNLNWPGSAGISGPESDSQAPLPQGYTQYEPELGWAPIGGRYFAAQLLSAGRADWRLYEQLGGVFTFDQERTGLARAISRQVWNVIRGTAEAARDNEELRTADPRTILIDLALQSLVPESSRGQTSDAFHQIQERYARIGAPRKLVGVVRDSLGEFDVNFSDGENDYAYEGLSSGEKNVLLLLIRFVAERIDRSLVMIDELELNQHPIWQRKLLHLLPQMGEDNQIIATTHSPYLRDAVRPDAVIDLGALDEHGEEDHR